MDELKETLRQQVDRLSRIEGLLLSTKRVLNMDEVSTLTGLSKSHLYKLTCYQKIPHFKQGKHNYFERSSIENWLLSNPVKTFDEIEKEAATAVTLGRKGGRA